VGKLYNVCAHQIAQAAVAEVSGVAAVRVHLVNAIGRPVREPAVLDIQARPGPGVRARSRSTDEEIY
jgi:S-adenosylmethionine synthetase